MSVIYLRHPAHGAKVAISGAEAMSDMQNGWRKFDPAELAPANALGEDDAPPTMTGVAGRAPLLESVNELQPRRRGRRPKEAAQ